MRMLTVSVAGRVYNYDYCVGKVGLTGPSFYTPQDFALGAGGNLYVVNKGNEGFGGMGVNKCTLDHQVLWEDRGFSYCGGQYHWPSSVDVDRTETVYVSDEYEANILIYDSDGAFLGRWGTKGSGDGELNGPSGIAFDREDNLYVVDSLNHRVQKFTKEGKLLAKWGSQGSGHGQFDMPWGISIDKRGDVYVADWRNGRVQKLTPDGEHLTTFGSRGRDDGKLWGPSGVAIDDEGDVYVTDWGNDRLNIYAPDGTFITAFTGDADELSPWAQDTVDSSPDYVKARKRVDLTPERWFKRPTAVNVDEEGRIMVLDSVRGRIQIYVKERNFVDAQFNL